MTKDETIRINASIAELTNSLMQAHLRCAALASENESLKEELKGKIKEMESNKAGELSEPTSGITGLTVVENTDKSAH